MTNLLPERQKAGLLAKGAFDFVMFLLVLMGVAGVGQVYVNSRHALERGIQSTTLKWAIVADQIGRALDLPREVPLVLWYIENGMRAENPANCLGIVGAHAQVRRGDIPCFELGSIGPSQVTEQLWLGAKEFKLRCPEVTYSTVDPGLLIKCYLAYDAGVHAADSLDPDQSAYVMNGYDAAHQNMVYRDLELGTLVPQGLGAWPTHLAMQSVILGNWDLGIDRRPLLWVDELLPGWKDQLGNWDTAQAREPENPRWREPRVEGCLVEPHRQGDPTLKPDRQPVVGEMVLIQDLHGCHYSFPGIDLSSVDTVAPLQAPMIGELATYSDQWGDSTIRIENQEWIVWILHPCSYFIKQGSVQAGDLVGVMGPVRNSTAPYYVHYTVYDKVNGGFVDPGHLIYPVVIETSP